MANFCCDLLGKPFIHAQMNLQRFIQKLHTDAHALEDLIEDSKRMEIRIANCLPENKMKVAVDRGNFYASFKTALAGFNSEFEGRYFRKVNLYYPEIAEAMKQFKAKINNNRHVLQMQKQGIL